MIISVFINLFSFFLIAVSGFCINILIGNHWGLSALGIFSKAMGVYFIASQIATFGLHISTSKHVSQYQNDENEQNKAHTSALLFGAVISLSFAILFWSMRSVMGRFLNSSEVVDILNYAMPALLPFALNKILLSNLNGRGRLLVYAIGNTLRAITLFAATVCCIILKKPVYYMGLVLLITEIVVFFYCFLVSTQSSFAKLTYKELRLWTLQHSYYGVRGFLGNIIVEIVMRSDVLILSLFVSNAIVGIYSFVTMITEGLLNSLGVIRSLVLAKIGFLLNNNSKIELQTFISRAQRIIYSSTVCLIIIGWILYIPVVKLLMKDVAILQGLLPLIILSIGLILCAGLFPFDTILVQSGYPEIYVLYNLVILILNVIFNLFFASKWGMVGAAFATSISFVLGGMALSYFIWRKTKYSLFFGHKTLKNIRII